MNRNSDFIPFALPSIGKEEKKAVMDVLESGWLTTGKKALEFEKRFAEITDAKHAITVNSATSGLHLVLESLGICRDSRVLTTPYTFASTAEVIRYMDAHPVFADINEDDYNIKPENAEKALKEQISNRGYCLVCLCRDNIKKTISNLRLNQVFKKNIYFKKAI